MEDEKRMTCTLIRRCLKNRDAVRFTCGLVERIKDGEHQMFAGGDWRPYNPAASPG